MNLYPFFTRSEREIWSVSALLNSVIKNCTSTKLLQKASNMKALQKKKKKKKMSRYKIIAKKKKKKKKKKKYLAKTYLTLYSYCANLF